MGSIPICACWMGSTPIIRNRRPPIQEETMPRQIEDLFYALVGVVILLVIWYGIVDQAVQGFVDRILPLLGF